jgi:hypothetical protein
MYSLYTFKGKVLILSFAFFALSYALTDTVRLFAMSKDGEVQISKDDPVPVVVLSDGENKKIMTVKDFFKTVSSNPDLTGDDLAKLVRLKNEIELGKAQIDVFKKLTEKKEDPYWKSVIKDGNKNISETLKSFLKPILTYAYDVAVIGGVAVVVLWYLNWLPKGEFIPTRPTRYDYKLNASDLTQPEIPKDYIYTDPSGKQVSYERQLCADNGWFKNFFRPSDCPPLK